MLKNSETCEILYIGEGKISDRVASHLNKAKIKDHPQRHIFGSIDKIQCSFIVKSEFAKNQRLEFENDLIGALINFSGRVPLGQFIG